MELLILAGLIVGGAFALIIGLSLSMSMLANPDHLEYLDEE
jgi:hypothetical protein